MLQKVFQNWKGLLHPWGIYFVRSPFCLWKFSFSYNSVPFEDPLYHSKPTPWIFKRRHAVIFHSQVNFWPYSKCSWSLNDVTRCSNQIFYDFILLDNFYWFTFFGQYDHCGRERGNDFFVPKKSAWFLIRK